MTDKFGDYATVDDFQPTGAPCNGGAGEMSAIDRDSVALEPRPGEVLSRQAAAGVGDIRVHGKFFFAGETKHFVKGGTYGPFAPGSHAPPFPESQIDRHDFALTPHAGATTAPAFPLPPL